MTSPIRRWADILAHFNIKAWLTGAPRPFSAADVEAINQATSSDRVREAGVAERMEETYWITGARDSLASLTPAAPGVGGRPSRACAWCALWRALAEFFRQMQSNKSAPHQWLATVLGWQREELRLAAVLIDEYGLETVVKVRALAWRCQRWCCFLHGFQQEGTAPRPAGEIERFVAGADESGRVCGALALCVQVDVDVAPGDTLQLALLEARPVAGVLRFFVSEYVSVSNAGALDEHDEAQQQRRQFEEDGAASAAEAMWERAKQALAASAAGEEDVAAEQEQSAEVAGGDEEDVTAPSTPVAVAAVESPLSGSTDLTFVPSSSASSVAGDAEGGAGAAAAGGARELALC